MRFALSAKAALTGDFVAERVARRERVIGREEVGVGDRIGVN